MPKNTTPAVPKYDVKIHSIRPEGSCKATASVNVYGDFAVRGIKIMEGSKGLFVSMPSYKAGNGEYKDICFPCTKEAKTEFDKTVLDAYQQVLTQGQTAVQKQKSPEPQQEQNQPVMGGM
ncbi:SpoVG family protein [Erysipelothrix anatis]|uniref:SpoVG family protein n=1 Tax=Erysipelothrix anatis TaxID=2683713 RepID=UPI00140E2C77|nr:SpoVG family protein [Erysipelothrix anatis]